MGIAPENQVNGFLLVRKRMGPTFNACRPERGHSARVSLELGLGGAQVVAVEIDAIRRGRKGAISRAELFKDERFIGAISNHRVGLA